MFPPLETEPIFLLGELGFTNAGRNNQVLIGFRKTQFCEISDLTVVTEMTDGSSRPTHTATQVKVSSFVHLIAFREIKVLSEGKPNDAIDLVTSLSHTQTELVTNERMI